MSGNLTQLGWNEFFREAFEKLGLEECVPARVIKQSRFEYLLIAEEGQIRAETSGSLKAAGLPAVGDWVAVEVNKEGIGGTIHEILPRRTVFSRKVAGEVTSEQVVAANVDFIFLVVGLDRDFNLRRIERYLTLIYNSGASPVIILNKADMCEDVESHRENAESVAPGTPVHILSAQLRTGFEQIQGYMEEGRTIAFLGSSGVGKSTVINLLLGEEKFAVRDVREADGKGRHTTTHRELVVLPGGGALIDTPGMREIQVWGDAEGLHGSFPEIEQMARDCRFTDCRHETEPGCAVLAAVAGGDLPEDRYGNYIKLRGELENLEMRRNESARHNEKLQGRRFSRMVREANRYNPKRS
jgi:ribosome biogenesis GTPase